MQCHLVHVCARLYVKMQDDVRKTLFYLLKLKYCFIMTYFCARTQFNRKCTDDHDTTHFKSTLLYT